ncbi:MAG: hypothetical protein WC676_08085 [Candidatus Omnitrophota bacterium]
MRTFKKLPKVFILTLLLIVASVSFSWAMTEDEYVHMAAESVIMMHDAKIQNQDMVKASEEFLSHYSQTKIQEYAQMAQQMIQDPKTAKRIGEKIADVLSRKGYDVGSEAGSDIGNIIRKR